MPLRMTSDDSILSPSSSGGGTPRERSGREDAVDPLDAIDHRIDQLEAEVDGGLPDDDHEELSVLPGVRRKSSMSLNGSMYSVNGVKLPLAAPTLPPPTAAGRGNARRWSTQLPQPQPENQQQQQDSTRKMSVMPAAAGRGNARRWSTNPTQLPDVGAQAGYPGRPAVTARANAAAVGTPWLAGAAAGRPLPGTAAGGRRGSIGLPSGSQTRRQSCLRGADGAKVVGEVVSEDARGREKVRL